MCKKSFFGGNVCEIKNTMFSVKAEGWNLKNVLFIQTLQTIFGSGPLGKV